MHEKAGIAAGAVVAVLAVAGGAWAVDWSRDGLPRSSRDGDACSAVGVAGGLVGLDPTTGEERWTNVVPPNGNLEAIDGVVHHQTLGHPEPLDRTLDADGSVVACDPIDPLPEGASRPVPGVDVSGLTPDPDRLIPGATVDGLTIVPWGDGLRATDEQGRGVWGTTGMEASSLLGEDLLVQTRHLDAERQAAARIDLRTGEPRWEVPGVIVNAEGARELVIVRDPAPATDPTYRALDLATGEERWRTTLGPDAHATIDPRAWEAGDLVLLATSDDGALVALDAATGERRWRTALEAPALSREVPETGQVADVAAAEGSELVVAIDAVRPEDYVD